jgi:hypothetical protein
LRLLLFRCPRIPIPSGRLTLFDIGQRRPRRMLQRRLGSWPRRHKGYCTASACTWRYRPFGL